MTCHNCESVLEVPRLSPETFTRVVRGARLRSWTVIAVRPNHRRLQVRVALFGEVREVRSLRCQGNLRRTILATACRLPDAPAPALACATTTPPQNGQLHQPVRCITSRWRPALPVLLHQAAEVLLALLMGHHGKHLVIPDGDFPLTDYEHPA